MLNRLRAPRDPRSWKAGATEARSKSLTGQPLEYGFPKPKSVGYERLYHVATNEF